MLSFDHSLPLFLYLFVFLSFFIFFVFYYFFFYFILSSSLVFSFFPHFLIFLIVLFYTSIDLFFYHSLILLSYLHPLFVTLQSSVCNSLLPTTDLPSFFPSLSQVSQSTCTSSPSFTILSSLSLSSPSPIHAFIPVFSSHFLYITIFLHAFQLRYNFFHSFLPSLRTFIFIFLLFFLLTTMLFFFCHLTLPFVPFLHIFVFTSPFLSHHHHHHHYYTTVPPSLLNHTFLPPSLLFPSFFASPVKAVPPPPPRSFLPSPVASPHTSLGSVCLPIVASTPSLPVGAARQPLTPHT